MGSVCCGGGQSENPFFFYTHTVTDTVVHTHTYERIRVGDVTERAARLHEQIRADAAASA